MSMSLAITGHRPKNIDNDYTLSSPTWKWIANQLKDIFEKAAPDEIISGMALGVDTLAAEMALHMQIPLVAAVPFKGQERLWPKESKQRYKEILDKAKEVHILDTTGTYSGWLMQKRNEWMVDRCDMLVAVWNGEPGGTRNCVNYADRKSVVVWRIDPKETKVGRYDGRKIVQKPGLVEATIRDIEKVS